VHSFDWNLIALNPHQGDALRALDEWYDCRDKYKDRDWLDTYYANGHRYHKGDLGQFTREDWKESRRDSKGRRIYWRNQMAKRLFGLRRVVIERAKAMDELAKTRYPLGHPLHSHFWLMRNCRPCAGEWVATTPQGWTPNNPTGKPCNSRFCPWCWLRRVEKLARMCRTSGEFIYDGKKTRGLGFPGLVNATIFEFRVDPAIPPPYEKFEVCPVPQSHLGGVRRKIVRAVPAPSLAYVDTYACRCYQALLQHALPGTFATPHFMRLLSPLYVERDKPDRVLELGARVAFLHTGEIDTVAIQGLGEVTTYHGFEIDEAIRFACPFPIDWLRNDDSSKYKFDLLTHFYTLRNFRINRVNKMKSELCIAPATPLCTAPALASFQ
jgi:hypothetical protein